MQIKKDSVKMIIDDHDFGTINFDVCLTWYLYPQVFIENKSLRSIPSVRELDGYCYPSTPNKLQRVWLRFFFSYSKYKKRVLIPYFANLLYYQIKGEFSNGGQGLGIESLTH